MPQAGSGDADQPGQVAGTDAEGATSAESAPEAPPRRGPAAGFRTGLVVAVVFVLGLTVGAVAVGLLGDSVPPRAPTGRTPDRTTAGRSPGIWTRRQARSG
ncbi:hypothetical protein [Blastococcus brunescens]|uniref:Uncharacterized protein n=1 Tax=Blastococcus brunescens TaxID=1564165 RepID=A0ABZ1B6E4_9ACTN|nr:hypothetical protein [Blastococcus sp. BMG 8361]WRL66356.1 hypothetical protein U6N30_13505 [Blastococcus sp. BMG 8361]